jgi:superoxide dismutase, Fe-Mn family
MMKVTMNVSFLFGFVIAISFLQLANVQAKSYNQERNLRRVLAETRKKHYCRPRPGNLFWVTKYADSKPNGAVKGKCSAQCPTICKHKPCFDDYTIVVSGAKDTCQCNPTGAFKCTLPNTRCANDDTCQCKAGFAGNATFGGCLDIGFSLPDLPYATNALEPNIDTRTMMIHHSKHHQTYITNLNKAVKGTPDASKPIVDLQMNALASGTAVRNNGGGHYNHAFFWKVMSAPDIAMKSKRSDQLQSLIDSSFVNVTNMITMFNTMAAPGSLFGSGWAWICVNQAGEKLILTTTPNQDNPLMNGVSSEILFPILALDVWEHAYYLKYQNVRNDYVNNFWNVVNWDVVSANCKYVIDNKKGVSV